MKTIKITLYDDKPATCEFSSLLTGREMQRVVRLLDVENGRQRREHQRLLRKDQTRNDNKTDVEEKNDGQRESEPEPARLPESTSVAGAIAARRKEQTEPRVDSTRATALAGVRGAQGTVQEGRNA